MLEHKILNEMPTKLRDEVAATNVQLISTVPFFSPEVRGSLDLAISGAKQLVPRVYVPETTIVYANEKMREMYIVREGTVDVFHTKNADSLCTLASGDYFGDYELVYGTVHPVAVKTGYAFVEMLVLTLDGFKALVAENSLKISDTEPGVLAMEKRYKETLHNWSHINSNLAAMADGLGAAEDYDPENFDVRKMLASQMAERGKTQFIIFPFDKWHGLWDPVLIMGTIYMCMMIPLRIMMNVSDFECRTPAGSGSGEDLVGGKGTILYSETLWPDNCDAKLYEQGKYVGFGKFDVLRLGDALDTLWDPTLVLDYLFDIVFMTDMYLRMFVMAFNDIQGGKDVLVVERPAIMKHYIRSFRFKIDLLSTFPIDLFGFAGGKWSLLRLTHLFRLFNLSTHISEWRDYLEEGLDGFCQIGRAHV